MSGLGESSAAKNTIWNCCICKSEIKETWEAFKAVMFRCSTCIALKKNIGSFQTTDTADDSENLQCNPLLQSTLITASSVSVKEQTNLISHREAVSRKRGVSSQGDGKTLGCKDDWKSCSIKLSRVEVPRNSQASDTTITATTVPGATEQNMRKKRLRPKKGEDVFTIKDQVVNTMSEMFEWMSNTLNEHENHLNTKDVSNVDNGSTSNAKSHFENRSNLISDEIKIYESRVLSIFDEETLKMNTSFHTMDNKMKSVICERDNFEAKLKTYNKIGAKKDNKINTLTVVNQQLLQENAQMKEEKDSMETTIHDLVMDKTEQVLKFPEATGTTNDPLDYEMSQIFGGSKNYPGYHDLQHAFAEQDQWSDNNNNRKGLLSSKKISIDKLQKLKKENKDMSLGLCQMVDTMQHFIDSNQRREDEIEYLIDTFNKN